MPSSTSSSDARTRRAGRLRTARDVLVFVLAALFAIEAATRVEQRLRTGVGLFAKYDYVSRLLTGDEHGLRGRPHGAFEKWRMNSLGFRGPEVASPKPPGRLRIACLGASETFGLFEPPGGEWPRRLEGALEQRGVTAEVVNAALAGLMLPSRIESFRRQVLPLEPDVVVLMLEFASYAGTTPETEAERRRALQYGWTEPGPFDGAFTLRSPSRLSDALRPRLPAWLLDRLERRKWERFEQSQRALLGDDFQRERTLTAGEREVITGALDGFLALADEHGVRAVLLIPVHHPDPEQRGLFLAAWPRVDPRWLDEARRGLLPELRQLAARRGARVLDLPAALAGDERATMVDFFHFSERGAERIGELVADEVMALLGAGAAAAGGQVAPASGR